MTKAHSHKPKGRLKGHATGVAGGLVMVLLELMGAVLAGAAVVGGLLAWRLSEGPLTLQALEPYVASTLGEAVAPLKVNVGQTALTWGRDRPAILLQATDVRVQNENGVLLVVVPEVEVGLSIPALLLGRPAPSSIRLVGPELNLIRTAEGAVQLTLATIPNEGEEPNAEFFQAWLNALARPPMATSLFGALRRVEISAASLQVRDYQFGVQWRAPDIDIALERGRDGIAGSARLALALAAQRPVLEGIFLYNRARGDVQWRAKLVDFNPARLSEWATAFASLKAVDLPLAGEVQGRWVPGLGLAQASFDLSSGAGHVQLPAQEKQLPVAYLKAVGSLDRQLRSLTLDNLYIDFGGPRLLAAAVLSRAGNEIAAAAEVRAHDMPAEKLAEFWQPNWAKNARDWVTGNITAGTVTMAEAEVRARLPLADPAALVLDKLEGRMALSGLTVHYFRPLPPATEADGSAQFDQDTFRIAIDRAKVFGANLLPSTVDLLDLSTRADRADIQVAVNGPVAAQLGIIDHPPLKYASRLGLVAERATGSATTTAHFSFPLLKNLKLEQLAVSVASKMENVGLPGIVAGQALENGALDLTLDGGGMDIKGTGLVGGAVAQFSWREEFLDQVVPGTRINFSATADEKARQAFKVAWPEVVGANVGVVGEYLKNRGVPGSLSLALDFTKADLSLPWLSWHKPAGEKASGSAVVQLTRDEVKAVPSFKVSGGGASVAGSIEFGDRSQWQKVALSTLSLPGTEAKGSITNRGKEGLAFDLSGRRIDVRALFDEAPVTETAAAPTPTPAPVAPEPPQPFAATFKFDRVVTGATTELQAVAGTAARTAEDWQRLDIYAKVAGGVPAVVRLVPQPGGARYLRMESADAGAFLAAFRILPNIRGGSLLIEGSGASGQPIVGVADLRDFSYVQSKTLAKLASTAKPEGAEAVSRESGIAFKRLKAKLDYDKYRVGIAEARLAGDVLGMTVENGTIDLAGKQIDMAGTFVPLYGLNSFISGVPVVGWLLTGGEGQGVFAATYRLSGPFSDPTTSVNPLSMLTPGFLRNLFFIDNSSKKP